MNTATQLDERPPQALNATRRTSEASNPADRAAPHAQIDLREHVRIESLKTRLRSRLQTVLGEVQFHFDKFPRLLYQPLPWLGLNESGRAAGTNSRWHAIKTEVCAAGVTTAVDVGCQAGFFTMSLAEMEIATLGIDNDARSLRIARHTAEKAKIQDVGWAEMTLTPKTMELVPSSDAVLLLSVWHHWVWSFGLDEATEMLANLWSRCNKVLFFETGQEEMTPEFGLPDMNGEPASWIENYLNTTCVGASVSNLGQHQAFGIGGNETANVAHRHLFAVRR